MQIEGEEGEDPVLAFRRTLGMFATGVTVITTQAGDQVHGMTANAFMSVSLRPPLVLISVDKRAKMHALLHEGKRIGVSVLSDDPGGAVRSVRRAPGGTEPRGELRRGPRHAARARARSRSWSRRVTRSYWGGDHSLFLGHVEYAQYGEGTPAPVPRRPLRALSAPEGSILCALPPASS